MNIYDEVDNFPILEKHINDTLYIYKSDSHYYIYDKIKHLLNDTEKYICIWDSGYIYFDRLFIYFRKKRDTRFVINFLKILNNECHPFKILTFICNFGNFDIFERYFIKLEKNISKHNLESMTSITHSINILLNTCDDIRLYDFINKLHLHFGNFYKYLIKCISKYITKYPNIVNEMIFKLKETDIFLIDFGNEGGFEAFKYVMEQYFHDVSLFNILMSVIKNPDVRLYKFIKEQYKDAYYIIIKNDIKLQLLVEEIIRYDNLRILEIINNDEKINQNLINAIIIYKCMFLIKKTFKIKNYVLKKFGIKCPKIETSENISFSDFNFWKITIDKFLDEPTKLNLTFEKRNQLLHDHKIIADMMFETNMKNKKCMIMGIEVGLDPTISVKTQMFGMVSVENLYETLCYL